MLEHISDWASLGVADHGHAKGLSVLRDGEVISTVARSFCLRIAG
jgi:hypothetical protein